MLPMRADGLIVGADVAIALWKLAPGQKWLAALFGNRVTLPFTLFFYDRFADLLFAWNRRKRRWVRALAPARAKIATSSHPLNAAPGSA